jgi:phosphoribosylamine--glycine ligase
MRVLLVGSGGREHALAWKLAQSSRMGELHAAPGNPGIGGLAQLHDVGVGDLEQLTELAGRLRADLVVIGPEAPLVAGLADRLRAAGIATFGPGAAAAQIEGSKAFAKEVMAAASVPTAAYAICDTPAAAQLAIAEIGGRVVVKADGLAAGKGVIVCESVAEAEAAVRSCLIDRRFGESGTRVLIEERMEGPEVSLLALSDGERVVALAPARDHKRLGDGDTGPNTGGMGCFSPVPDVRPDLVDEIVATVHRPVVDELRRRGTPFSGCLYAGLMLTAQGPRVIEFNARFGDPETQAILPRLEGDLLDALQRAAAGTLEDGLLAAADRACVSVALAAAGYPDAPQLGAAISGVEKAQALDGAMVFHAGTGGRPEALTVAGGRVLNVSAVGADLGAARDLAYRAAGQIRFSGAQYRTDIAADAAVESHV